MDGPHARQHGHHGGRGATTKVYRRVVGSETSEKTSEETKPAFKSSLLQSITSEKEKESAAGEGTASARGRGRGSARDSAAPSASQGKQRGNGNDSGNATGGRGGGGGRGSGGRGNGNGHGHGHGADRRSRSPRREVDNGNTGRHVTLETKSDVAATSTGPRLHRANSIESNASTSSKSRSMRKPTGADGHDEPRKQQSFRSGGLAQAGGKSSGQQDARYANGRDASRDNSTSRSSRGPKSQNRPASRDSSVSSACREGGSGESSSYRHVEMSRGRRSSSFRKTRNRSDSVESDASVQSSQSVQSVQSVQSMRSTSSRYDSGKSSRYDYKSHRSIDDGQRGDRLSLTSDRPPSGRIERSTSDFSSSSVPFRGRGGDDRGHGSRRFQDDRQPRSFERPTSDHHSGTGSHHSESTLAAPLRGSTLASSSLSKTPAPVIVAKPFAKSSQDVRFAGSANAPPPAPAKFTSSLVSSLSANVGTKTGADKSQNSTSSLRNAQSSLKSSLAPSVSAVVDQKSSAEDEERHRQASERMKERFAARNAGQGSSLSQLASKLTLAADASTSVRTETASKPVRSVSPTRDARPTGSILSRVGDRPPAPSDKEARTREFFAKLDKDDAQRELSRRTEGSSFKSSLTGSIPTPSTKPTLKETLAARGVTPFKSSLTSSIAARQVPSAAPIMDKTVYSLADLRKLMPTSPLKCPPDLRDMKIVEVIEEKPPRNMKPTSSASGRRVEVSSRRGGASKRGGLTRGASQSGKLGPKNDRQRSGPGGGGGGRRGGPPPPPLYDGPIEPLTVSENRWVPKKADKSEFEATLSHVKSVLNKLTREKFAKLTDELCSTAIDSMEMLGSIIGAIMNKAIEEPNFADVYADLCKEFHVRTASKTWSFLRAVQRIGRPNVFSWTAVRKDDTAGFVGPFPSENECIDAASSSEDAEEPEKTTDQDMWKATLYATDRYVVAVVEASKTAFYYKRKTLVSLNDNEPVLGEYESAAAAIQSAAKESSFKRLLVSRCQMEFEKFNKTEHSTDEDLDKRQKDLNALRLKRLMLGNIRFIGELFKADLLNQTVVQACLFYLLGLELVKDPKDEHLAGQEVRFPDEEDIEALCKLLATVGKKYDKPKTQQVMRIVILRLVELSDEQRLPSRARFLLKDILEMRDHLWEPRRKELQQKTLEEVRREAMKLQSQGKNAQHDDLKQRRLKSQVSSVQLAKESSNLLVRKDTLSENTAAESTGNETPVNEQKPEGYGNDDGKIETRIKSIIQEYCSIHDIEEAKTCVRELPRDRLVDFAEVIVNRALEGKDQERHDVVELLVKLYEGGAVDAMSIQLALVNVMEFLEDIKIDIPLVHQYSALVLGRLIAAGCFGLSWMMSTALQHLVDGGLASLVFAETLPVIEADSDERTVVRMVADEEVSAASVLPRSMRRDEAAIAKFVQEHDLAFYLGAERPHEEDDDDDDELDPSVEAKLRSTLNEYLSVKDLNEVVLCVNELAGENLWRHFVRVAVSTSLSAKQATRMEVASLFHRLITECHDDVDAEDMEWAFESALIDYEDVRVDVPRLAHNFAELWTPLFEKPECLTLAWLHEAVTHLLATGDAADVLNALLTRIELTCGREELVQWWQKQKPSSDVGVDWLKAFSGSDATSVHACLAPWQQAFGPAQP